MIALGQRATDRVEQIVHDQRGVVLRDSRARGDFFDQIRLRHVLSPPCGRSRGRPLERIRAVTLDFVDHAHDHRAHRTAARARGPARRRCPRRRPARGRPRRRRRRRARGAACRRACRPESSSSTSSSRCADERRVLDRREHVADDAGDLHRSRSGAPPPAPSSRSTWATIAASAGLNASVSACAASRPRTKNTRWPGAALVTSSATSFLPLRARPSRVDRLDQSRRWPLPRRHLARGDDGADDLAVAARARLSTAGRARPRRAAGCTTESTRCGADGRRAARDRGVDVAHRAVEVDEAACRRAPFASRMRAQAHRRGLRRACRRRAASPARRRSRSRRARRRPGPRRRPSSAREHVGVALRQDQRIEQRRACGLEPARCDAVTSPTVPPKTTTNLPGETGSARSSVTGAVFDDLVGDADAARRWSRSRSRRATRARRDVDGRDRARARRERRAHDAGPARRAASRRRSCRVSSTSSTMPTITESTGLSRVASVRRADEPAATSTTSSRPAPTASADDDEVPGGLRARRRARARPGA